MTKLSSLDELKRQAILAARDDPWIMEMLHQSACEWITSIQGSLSRELTEKEKDQLISAYKACHFKSRAYQEGACCLKSFDTLGGSWRRGRKGR